MIQFITLIGVLSLPIAQAEFSPEELATHPNAVRLLMNPDVQKMLATDPALQLKLLNPEFRKTLAQDPKALKAKEEYLRTGKLPKELPTSIKPKAGTIESNGFAQAAPEPVTAPTPAAGLGEYQTEIDYLSNLAPAQKDSLETLHLPPPSSDLPNLGTYSDYPF